MPVVMIWPKKSHQLGVEDTFVGEDLAQEGDDDVDEDHEADLERLERVWRFSQATTRGTTGADDEGEG